MSCAGTPPRSTTGALAQAAAYRDVTAAELPWLVEELDGVAEGAGADPLAVFAASIEEIAVDEPAPASRCSDLVATAPATPTATSGWPTTTISGRSPRTSWSRSSGASPATRSSFTIGIGPWISVGFNSAGLALTGNELSPNDDRVGIPRLLLVRDILRRRTLAEAIEAALHPRRASSYNNLLSHRDGGVVSVEGSATDAELLRPGRARHAGPHEPLHERRGWPLRARSLGHRGLVRPLPLRPRGSNAARRRRELLRDALSDHAGAPDSLCRHLEHGAQSKTVFWCLADVTEGTIRYGRGNPCDSQEQRYAFD